MTYKFALLAINLDFKPGTSGLYVSGAQPARDENGYLVVRRKTRCRFDGLMSALFERETRLFVEDRQLELHLELVGAATVRVIHRSQTGEEISLAAKAVVHDSPRELAIAVSLTQAEYNTGRVFFEIEASEKDVWLILADWRIDLPVPPPKIRPEIVICTYRREKQVTRNIALIVQTLMQAEIDFGITVVDNAGTLTRDLNYSDNIRLIQQRNLGGSGGFGRGILEVLKDDKATHIILLDDDADIDPTSLVRMINLMRINPNDARFIGGMQLDAFAPTMIADAGAFWHPSDFEKVSTRQYPDSLEKNSTLDNLCRLSRSNFNGWWMFGGARTAFASIGLPLPMFVHVDDIEYGIRIIANGGETVTFPGVAIWHEPYYAKLEGWFAYYNIRNELIRQACQADKLVKMTRLVKKLRRRHAKFLLTYQYGSAALLNLAIEDFLKGPALLTDDDPEAIQARILKIYRERNENYTLTPFVSSHYYRWPKKRNLFKRLLDWVTANGNRFSVRNTKSAVMLFASAKDIKRQQIAGGLPWGYGDPQTHKLHKYVVDRAAYKACMKDHRRVLNALKSQYTDMATKWKAIYPTLTSINFWQKIKFEANIPVSFPQTTKETVDI